MWCLETVLSENMKPVSVCSVGTPCLYAALHEALGLQAASIHVREKTPLLEPGPDKPVWMVLRELLHGLDGFRSC